VIKCLNYKYEKAQKEVIFAVANAMVYGIWQARKRVCFQLAKA